MRCVVGRIADRAHHCKRDAVLVTYLRHGRTFHFDGERTRTLALQRFYLVCGIDKLIARNDKAFMHTGRARGLLRGGRWQ